jgi:uncharacterized membrane protein YfcA
MTISYGGFAMEFAGQRGRSYLDTLLSLPLIPCICFLLFAIAAYWSWSLLHAEATLWIVLFCAVLSSVAGFAFSPLAGAILFHVNADAVMVVQILLVASIAQQIYCVWGLRTHIRAREFLPYTIGSLTTLPFGIFLLLKSQASSFLPMLGLLLVGYGSFVAIRPTIELNKSNPLPGRILAGALGGITGGLAAFPAAFVAIWCQAQGFDKERQRSIVQPFILTNQIVAITILSFVSPVATISFQTIQYAAPAILGAYFGLCIFRRLKTSEFNRIVGAALAIAGTLMVLKAI